VHPVEAADDVGVEGDGARRRAPAPAAAAKTSRGAIPILKAADSRILRLEADVRRREGELAELNGRLAQAQVRG